LLLGRPLPDTLSYTAKKQSAPEPACLHSYASYAFTVYAHCLRPLSTPTYQLCLLYRLPAWSHRLPLTHTAWAEWLPF
jgi:hypothetical protein